MKKKRISKLTNLEKLTEQAHGNNWIFFPNGKWGVSFTGNYWAVKYFDEDKIYVLQLKYKQYDEKSIDIWFVEKDFEIGAKEQKFFMQGKDFSIELDWSLF